MSAYHPPSQATSPTTRPGTATAGAIISIVMIGIALVFLLIAAVVVLSNRTLMGVLDFVGAGGTVVALLVLGFAVGAVGLTAGIQTLRNSNAWRITLVVFAFITAGLAVIAAIGSFNEKHACASYSYYRGCAESSGNAAGGVIMLLWSVLALSAGILLLVNGANQFYASAPHASARPQPLNYPPTVTVAPAGWYPVDGGQLRWWDGSAWTEHFHNPNA